jgi:small nuclear ribonucleoprotein (snRNP)-like protein
MTSKCLSIVFIALLALSANLQNIFAQSSTDKTVEKIKADVSKRVARGKTKVVVKLKDGRKLKGYISRTSEDSFNLTDSKTKQTTAIAYDSVAKIKGQGLSAGAKIAIGVGIAAAAVVLILTRPGGDPFPGGICPLGCGPF